MTPSASPSIPQPPGAAEGGGLGPGRVDPLAHLRLPPHSVEAEQSVLGGLLLDNTAWDKVVDLLKPDDFYRADHRLIWEHIAKLIESARPADVVTVYESLQNAGRAEDVGGLQYLNALAQDTPSAANIRRYGEIVRDRSVLRQLVSVGDEIVSTALLPQGKETRDILDVAESKLYAIAEQGSRGKSGFQDFQSLVAEVVEKIDHLYQMDGGSDVTGVPSGFVDLDVKTAGMHPGDLIIVAGRPSMGKTSFAMNIAEHVAIDSGLPVAVFSMEMGGAQLAMRMLCSVGRLDQQRIRTGRLTDDDWQRLTHTMQKVEHAQIFIDETPGLNPLEMRARTRRLARQFGKLGLIVVDYLQLMSGSATAGENRTAEISEISRSLKGLAKEIGCPLIALSQLNRTVEQRTDKRPVMSDLRESGAIEQDADVIYFIYRDEVYNKESPDKGSAEIIIAKQRNGPIGMVRLTFVGQFTKFENYVGGNAFSSGDY